MSEESKNGIYRRFFEDVIHDLPQRSCDVLRRRFGIDPDVPQTLHNIGTKYGLTRERIRQIVDSGIMEIQKTTSSSMVDKIYRPLEEKLKASGNIMPEKDLIKSVSPRDESEKGAIRFFLETAKKINQLKRKDVVKTMVHVEFDEKQWERVRSVVKAILNNVREPLAHDLLHKEYLEHKEKEDISKEMLHHFLTPVKDIQKNPFGRWGMSHWRDVTPRGIREKIYLVLKEHGEPMHFRDIAKNIDKHGLGKCPNKSTNIQTVHNELIKDQRFILVGRGLYGLGECGYTSGTVRDVITSILRKHGKMSVDEIVKRVLDVRDVRKMTIIVNLNNYFKKIGNGLYDLPNNHKI